MPLDPVFAERLRVHRRYLLGQAWRSMRKRLTALWSFDRDAPAPAPAPGDTPAETSPTAGDTPRTAAERGVSAKARHRPAITAAGRRAKHRRAALNWDRTELETVGTAGPDIPTTEHMVEVPGYPAVRVRIYRPDLDETALPACLAFFGGAFRIGGIDYPTTDAAFRRRAADARIAVVAVDYALAPEHRYPTQVEQGYAALHWLFAHAAELGIDADRIGIGGVSAGANLAAAVTLRNRDEAGLPLRLQVLEVPVTDLTGRHLDLRATYALRIPALIALRELWSVARTYLPSRSAALEQSASPLRAATHARLPPAVILTAEYDPLRGDGEAYAAALRRAGVDASAVRYLGVTHDTAIFTGVLPAARRWHADVVTALRRLHD